MAFSYPTRAAPARAGSGPFHVTPPAAPRDEDVVAIRAWGKPVLLDEEEIGFVAVCDRGWGAFALDGSLFSTHRAEHLAVQAVKSHAGRRL
jgi:hypothetical protein